jgi:isopropylmalate/homocitrate/citramalate synthase
MVLHSFAQLRAAIPVARKERARALRMIDLLKLSRRDLINAADTFGVSTRGQYSEILERIHRHIWQQVYDR